MRLGFNVDHIAYLREIRKTNDPDPLEAVFVAKRCGVSQITIHLREDRRHIQDDDAFRIVRSSFLPVNVECSNRAEITDIVCDMKPSRITLVPENRDEVTTEGGLALCDSMSSTIDRYRSMDIETSLFIEPDVETVKMAKNLGASYVEIHTGRYSNIYMMLNSNLSITHNKVGDLDKSRTELKELLSKELDAIQKASTFAKNIGLRVCAGHGLNYVNVHEILRVREIEELNIGQSIVARAVFAGLSRAIEDMLSILREH